MKKLKLNLDEIKVESFRVDKIKINEGTILAQDSGAQSGCFSCGVVTYCNDYTCDGYNTCDPVASCDLTCPTEINCPTQTCACTAKTDCTCP